MNPISLQRHLDHLEEELQSIKWRLSGFPLILTKKTKKPIRFSIIQATSGILGKRFPLGCHYEDSIRRSWRHHNGR